MQKYIKLTYLVMDGSWMPKEDEYDLWGKKMVHEETHTGALIVLEGGKRVLWCSNLVNALDIIYGG